ncbi:MAG: hypothetical protein U5L45_06545 [Saprospiraceae bacterium]|nr:hypothetical protein [Saprospiraceae bacterium]
MVRFSAKPKNEPHSPPSRERSEREMQKTILGYAHLSNICNYLAHSSPRSQKRGMWFVFRALPEKRTTSSPTRERSERVAK